MTEIRHPEKIKRVSNVIPKKPSWIRVKAPTSKFFKSTNKIIKDKKIVTVCEEAACPNIAECWHDVREDLHAYQALPEAAPDADWIVHALYPV